MSEDRITSPPSPDYYGPKIIKGRSSPSLNDMTGYSRGHVREINTIPKTKTVMSALKKMNEYVVLETVEMTPEMNSRIREDVNASILKTTAGRAGLNLIPKRPDNDTVDINHQATPMVDQNLGCVCFGFF